MWLVDLLCSGQSACRLPCSASAAPVAGVRGLPLRRDAVCCMSYRRDGMVRRMGEKREREKDLNCEVADGILGVVFDRKTEKMEKKTDDHDQGRKRQKMTQERDECGGEQGHLEWHAGRR